MELGPKHRDCQLKVAIQQLQGPQNHFVLEDQDDPVVLKRLVVEPGTVNFDLAEVGCVLTF